MSDDVATDRIITGDCLEAVADLPRESVHACVTDPPYGLAFMGNSWDDFEPKEYQQWCEQWAREVKRVLKPGGHMLSFSGTRTYHRLGVGVEDAGFEIRDKIDWLYGSGFPKALDVSKAIDKQADAEREVVGEKTTPDGKPYSERKKQFQTEGSNEGYKRPSDDNPRNELTAPATDAAEQWDGFKTALKPAHEPVCVARKPFSQTVAENVLEHGTGALNIDGCRIEHENGGWTREGPKDDFTGGSFGEQDNNETYMPEGGTTSGAENGRYPSNVVFDEQAAEGLDREVGELSTGDLDVEYSDEGTHIYGEYGERHVSHDGDTGGPSRYFYTSKATKAERTLDGTIENDHPTVKPTDLMEWLVTLVTAEEQTVLDPFCGSGTTGMACKNKNRDFIGIEQNERYADIARVRVGLEPNDPSVVRGDKQQEGLENF